MRTALPTQIVCGFCAQSFVEDQGQPACRSCPLSTDCRYIRCPNCGYENPVSPRWLTRLTRWMVHDESR
jgi:hypothetical protein